MAPISNGTGPPSPKRPRRTYGDWELNRLETVFLNNSYPDREQRNNLAKEMNVSPKNIQIWFQNRRARARLLRRKADGIVENPIERMKLHWVKTPPPPTTGTRTTAAETSYNDENKPPSTSCNSFLPFRKQMDSGQSTTVQIQSDRSFLRPIQSPNELLRRDQSSSLSTSSEDSRSRADLVVTTMTTTTRDDSDVVSSTSGQCPMSVVSNLSDISNSSFVDLNELDLDQPDVFTEAIMTIFSPNLLHHQTAFNFE